MTSSHADPIFFLPPLNHNDTEAFLDLFERLAEACGWPLVDWPVWLIPLLSGEEQVAAQQLPDQNLLVYEDLEHTILQWVPESRAAPPALQVAGP